MLYIYISIDQIMYFSKFTRKQSKKKYIKSQQQTAKKQSKKNYIKSQQQTAKKQSKNKSIKSFLLPKRSNKTESKSASETTIDTIISNITKQDISDDEKIQMICDELSQLKSIVFYGVLTLPYIKSKVSKGEYDRGQTLGGMIRQETNALKLTRLKKELEKIDTKINTTESDIVENDIKLAAATIKAREADEKARQATPKNKLTLDKDVTAKKQTKQRLEAKNVEYKIALSKYENKKQELSNDIKQLEADAEERRRQEADAMIHADTIAREVDILNRCLEKYKVQYVDFNNILEQIEDNKNRFMEQISSIDSHFEHMTSNIIRRIGTNLDNINKTNYDNRLLDYKSERQRMPQYRILLRKLVDSINAVNNCRGRIRALPEGIAPINFTEADRITLTCANQFEITGVDCNKVFRSVQSGMMTKVLGLEILDVWLENTRRVIELEKELFSKGYKGSRYLTNYAIYKEEFDKIDSTELEKKLNEAFETSRTRAAHTKVKTIPLSEAGSGFMCFFYSDFDRTTAIQRATLHQPRDNFHFTLHLDEGDPAIHEDLPHRNINKYSSGSIHLTAATGMNMYKANMRPYIFEKDTDQPPIDEFIGLPRCIQILPVYPGDATEASEVIYVGRIVTDTLNTYLKELAIDSQMLIEKAAHNSNFRENTYRPIIDKLRRELQKQIKLVKKPKYLAEIQIFEETLAAINADLQQHIEVIEIDDECKIFFERRIKEPYEETLGAAEKELNNKKEKFKDDENGMDSDILVEIARQGVQLEDVFPAEFFPEGGHINLRDIAARAAAEAAAEGKYKRKKYTRKRLNKVSKKRRHKISRNRTNKYSIYKIKSKINKNKQK